MAKRIVAKVTKTGNNLVGSKMADKRFYFKHKSYFHHDNKCHSKILLHRTQYFKKFQTCWKKPLNNPLDLKQETVWK